ncbi:L-lactate MFS transporter [Merdibacter massiliensis]|uniref:L-lactate MFS transporter n=1 Tax=Merdibacter massiliensis TaxID=1871030 RepID=UPI00096A6658|nr:OFA family MFS transporter [Merdibacter massiliensis]
MNLTQKRWLILAACCLANLCLGSIYTWSVFASPMADHLSNLSGLRFTSSDLAIVYTIANSVGPITMISGGWFNDKLGPRNVILVGGLMFGLGMFFSGFATSVSFLIITYGLIYGLGLGMAYGATISTCVKFFPDKRGLTGGLTTAAYGLSSVILPPVVASIVEVADVLMAFRIVGIVFLIILCVCALFIEKCPEGFVPEGWTPPSKQANATRMDKDWKGMLKSPIFYIMMLMLCCGAFSGMMYTSQARSVAETMIGMSVLSASTVVSVVSLFNVFGRLLAGYLSDKIGRVQTLALSCSLCIFGLFNLYISAMGDTLTFYIGSAILGLCFGAFMGVFPGFTADQFGPKNNSVNFGIMFIGFAVAGYFGPTIMASTAMDASPYKSAFLIAAILNFAGIILTFVYRFMNKKIKFEERKVNV